MIIGQVTPETEWELERMGCITASKITPLFVEVSRKMTPDELANREPGDRKTTIVDPNLFGDGAITYLREIVGEITTGTVRQMDGFSLEWGKQYEPEAALVLKKLYPDMIYYGKENPTFIRYSDNSGGSPDAVIPSIKAVGEFKCPENPANHIAYCELTDGNDLKENYPIHWHQIQFNMACVAKENGWSFMDMQGLFVSYCPIINERFKKNHIVVVEPDHDFFFRLPGIIERGELELKNRVNKMKL